jgi:ADP-heptose:LPS heptosyltransferase
MVKFLIVRLSSIGDIVLTTPVIRALKQQVEVAEVHFLTKPQYSIILENNPYLTKIHLYQPKSKEFIESLRDEFFDYVIDLHKNLRTHFLKNKLGIYAFTFEKFNWEKWLLVQFKINKLPDKHIVERYLESVKIFDVHNDQKGLDYFISVNDEVNLLSLPQNMAFGYIAFAIGAQHFTKKIPVEKIVSICNQLETSVILLGGKEDFENGEIIKGSVKNISVFNACGKYSLNESASLVRQAKLVITGDTGLMHIAAAFKKRIISIWGNTVPQFGMYPYMPDNSSIIIEVKDLKCRPCSKIGLKKCPKKHFNCMQKIDNQHVAELANLLALKSF